MNIITKKVWIWKSGKSFTVETFVCTRRVGRKCIAAR